MSEIGEVPLRMKQSGAQVTQASALDRLLNQVDEHNDQLVNILGNVRGFLNRSMGEELTQAAPTPDKPASTGALSAVNEQLVRQTGLISDLRDAVNTLEKIA